MMVLTISKVAVGQSLNESVKGYLEWLSIDTSDFKMTDYSKNNIVPLVDQINHGSLNKEGVGSYLTDSVFVLLTNNHDLEYCLILLDKEDVYVYHPDILISGLHHLEKLNVSQYDMMCAKLWFANMILGQGKYLKRPLRSAIRTPLIEDYRGFHFLEE